MNYTIKVDGKLYNVRILDLHSTPIRVVVDDTEIEVWPEQTRAPGQEVSSPAPSGDSPPVRPPAVAAPRPTSEPLAPAVASDPRAVKAPLPGVVVAIKVKAGEAVGVGQELCVIEAMKMKNVIRATRPGKIATIAVNIGETVQHHDLLMEYESE